MALLRLVFGHDKSRSRRALGFNGCDERLCRSGLRLGVDCRLRAQKRIDLPFCYFDYFIIAFVNRSHAFVGRKREGMNARLVEHTWRETEGRRGEGVEARIPRFERLVFTHVVEFR